MKKHRSPRPTAVRRRVIERFTLAPGTSKADVNAYDDDAAAAVARLKEVFPVLEVEMLANVAPLAEKATFEIARHDSPTAKSVWTLAVLSPSADSPSIVGSADTLTGARELAELYMQCPPPSPLHVYIFRAGQLYPWQVANNADKEAFTLSPPVTLNSPLVRRHARARKGKKK